jgi:hypothetical protein
MLHWTNESSLRCHWRQVCLRLISYAASRKRSNRLCHHAVSLYIDATIVNKRKRSGTNVLRNDSDDEVAVVSRRSEAMYIRMQITECDRRRIPSDEMVAHRTPSIGTTSTFERNKWPNQIT